MSIRNWIRGLFSVRVLPITRNNAKRLRLAFEMLEDRCVPTVSFHVPEQSVSFYENEPTVISVDVFGEPGATVGYATSNGTATAGADYSAASGTIAFGQSYVKTIEVQWLGGPADAKTFVLTLSNATGTELGTPSVCTVDSTVTGVNDAPSFTASDPDTVDMFFDEIEVSNWVASFSPGGGADEAGQTVSEYVVSNISNPGLFSVAPSISTDGTLTYTLTPYSYGTSTFDVAVKDNGGTANGGQDTSAFTTFTLQVNNRRRFTVNTANDTNDANVQNNQPLDGRALDANGDTSLRAAIQEGNNFPVDTIVSIDFNLAGGSTINLGTELPNLNRNFRISGSGQLTIRRLEGAATFRIFTVNSGTEVVIRDVSIKYGNAAGVGAAGRGGGILNQGNLEVYGTTFEYNTAAGAGGAIENDFDGILIVSGSDMHYNTASEGGAIDNRGTATILGATMIYVNTATRGGGIHNLAGYLTISGASQIYSNTATGEGGGIYNVATLVMDGGSILYNNWATNYGGGLYQFSGSAELTQVIINQNRANGQNGKGGGIYVRAGVVLATSCTITGNISGATLFDAGSWLQNSGVLNRLNCNTTGNFWEDPNP